LNLYAVGKPIVAVFYKCLFRLSVEGMENIPKSGGVLICSNHISDFDPPLIGIALKRELSFIAKEELFRIPLFGRLIRHLHAFPVKRGTGDRGALRFAIKLLNSGHVLLMFPEGHRNTSGHLGKGHAGAGFFALHADAKVVPCAILGRYGFRKQLKVIFDKPIDTDEMKKQKMRAADITAVIMARIGKLLERQ
jgi:1-acyl-sn-glycerol-3-phosphate acyltransferase